MPLRSAGPGTDIVSAPPVSTLLRDWEMVGLNLGPETVNPDCRSFMVFLSPSSPNAGIVSYLKLGHDPSLDTAYSESVDSR
jgi:hypothetical protein